MRRREYLNDAASRQNRIGLIFDSLFVKEDPLHLVHLVALRDLLSEWGMTGSYSGPAVGLSLLFAFECGVIMQYVTLDSASPNISPAGSYTAACSCWMLVLQVYIEAV